MQSKYHHKTNGEKIEAVCQRSHANGRPRTV